MLLANRAGELQYACVFAWRHHLEAQSAVLDIRGDVVAVAPPPVHEVAERQRQTPLFTAAVRRDIYRVLLSPATPGAPPATPSATASPAGVEAGLAVNKAPPGACAFGVRSAPLLPG